MAILDILTIPDPRLRNVAEPVTVFDAALKKLSEDMLDTMYAAPGIGLAASQVDQHIQLIVMDLSEDKSQPQIFINPKVTPLTTETALYQEGCLSVPDVFDDVARPTRVKIEAQDISGKAFSLETEGLLAVCIQHEMDHLRGKLFVDYLSPLKRQRAREKVEKHRKKLLREKVEH